ncbi:MAG: hypothetical protein J6T76_00780 [Paludibacteraceae bacterium]|nr:hypothetical protein [Paludibacteraceae bacterium]
MRHTLLKTLIGTVALVLSAGAMAQDIIVTTAAQKIEAKITEVTKSEIRYKEKDYLDGPTFVLSTDEISSIIYANGKVVLYNQPVVKEKPEQAEVKVEEPPTLPLTPSPEVTQAEEPQQATVDESMADILLLSGQTIEAQIVEMKSDHVTYVVGDEESTFPASQIETVTFKNGQVKAFNAKAFPVIKKKSAEAQKATTPRTSGRIYRDNNEYMHNDRYISKKEVARILEMEDQAAYKQWKKAEGLLIGGAVCTGIGSGLAIGGLVSLSSGSYVPCLAMDCIALIPLGVGLGLCFGSNAHFNKAIDIYNSKYDKAAVQLKWHVASDGVGLAIAF